MNIQWLDFVPFIVGCANFYPIYNSFQNKKRGYKWWAEYMWVSILGIFICWGFGIYRLIP